MSYHVRKVFDDPENNTAVASACAVKMFCKCFASYFTCNYARSYRGIRYQHIVGVFFSFLLLLRLFLYQHVITAGVRLSSHRRTTL